MEGLHTNASMPVPVAMNSALDCLSSTPKPLSHELEDWRMEIEKPLKCEDSLAITNSRNYSWRTRNNASHRKKSIATARTGRTSKVSSLKPEPRRSSMTFGVPVEIIFRNMQLKSRVSRFAGFLEPHAINAKHRAKLIDWMLDTLKVLDQKEQTLFRAILILDQYFSKAQTRIQAEELYLVGCVSMMIASKQEEIKPLTVEMIVGSVGKKNFSREQILALETKMLLTIGFQLSIPTLYEVCRGACYLFALDDHQADRFFIRSCLLISIMCLMSYDMVSRFTYEEVSAYSMILSMKLLENLKVDFSAQPLIKQIIDLFELSEQHAIEGLRAIHCFTMDFQLEMPFIENLQRHYSLANSS